ncbi:MAG: hypothetical protein IJ711_06645 [Lachnospiraceae bacterium]|nr:hypothetical protein [Lachnospiraceae bacterium]
MKYEEFITQLELTLSKMVQDDETVHIQKVPKNNGVTLIGICIVRKGGKIIPTIYLDEYYRRLRAGSSMEEIANEILDKHRQLVMTDDKDFGFFTEFEQVKSRIVFRLVNYDRNKERLAQMPYERYLDLAVVFYCHLSAERGGHAAIPIYTQHLKMWKVEKSEVFRWARRNTPKLFPCELTDMKTMIQTVMSEEEKQECERIMREEGSGVIPMYILTNVHRLNGASVILYRKVLDDFAKSCKGSFFLLPSSIHEVILVPAQNAVSMEELSQMVRDVNETQVEAEEFLSDHAYYYDAESRRLLCEIP